MMQVIEMYQCVAGIDGVDITKRIIRQISVKEEIASKYRRRRWNKLPNEIQMMMSTDECERRWHGTKNIRAIGPETRPKEKDY